jgi:UTP:GlnB (protein PII) uridylyltransferase
VPAPDCPETGAQVPESKRSKCEVLQDTANAVRELRQRCEDQATELEALRAMALGASHGPTQQSESPATIGTPHPTIVKVCGGEPGRWLLIISCADRRGLLLDIMKTVRGLGLSVVRASIVTKTDGCVHDVFETLHANPPVAVHADTVRAALEAAISNAWPAPTGAPDACGASKRNKTHQ